MLVSDYALKKIFFNDLVLFWRLEAYFAASKTVSFVRHQPVKGDDGVVARQIGGDVVRVGYANVGRGAGRDIRDDVIVDHTVIRIELELDLDVRVKLLESGDGVLIYLLLNAVVIVFRPENDLILL